MTTVVSLANMPSTPTDVAVKLIDQTKILPRSFNASTNGSIVSEYVFADGDPTRETTVTVRINVDKNNNVVRSSIRLQTIQIVTVDSVVTEEAPIEVVLAWNTPGIMEDPGKVLDMIGTAYSLVFNGVTSKVPNTGIISAINRGLTSDLYG